jgi:hypothetical protein
MHIVLRLGRLLGAPALRAPAAGEGCGDEKEEFAVGPDGRRGEFFRRVTTRLLYSACCDPTTKWLRRGGSGTSVLL